MKTLHLIFGLVAIAFLLTACQDNQNNDAQDKVDRYSTYVDSVSKVTSKDIAMNWEAIESNYERNKNEANNAITYVEDNSEMQESINSTTKRYESFKTKVERDAQANSKVNSKENIRKVLIGENYDGDDMTFTWINKDNILGVYKNFVDTVDDNKDSYSREEWDEIKLLYEAIDTRKNTVENEGLTGEDNRKIAALKLKFAPMYTFHRMGAKSAENEAAKQ